MTTDQQSEHTQLWIADEEFTDRGSKVNVIRNERYEYLVDEWGLTKDAAELLTSAVNERPKLLARIKRLEEATKALMDAGTYLLAVQANKKLVETANSKFTAALETARAALTE